MMPPKDLALIWLIASVFIIAAALELRVMLETLVA